MLAQGYDPADLTVLLMIAHQEGLTTPNTRGTRWGNTRNPHHVTNVEDDSDDDN